MILRPDNGGKYTSKELISFCKEVGIKRELIVPYNPQLNGVAKRKNTTMKECVKEMMHDQDFPMFLWSEASTMAVYIQNRGPHRILADNTPKEMFIRKKP